MTIPNPCECPICGGYKSVNADKCIWCQARLYVVYRENRALAAQGPAAYFAKYDHLGRLRA